jgi:hypothetical protein
VFLLGIEGKNFFINFEHYDLANSKSPKFWTLHFAFNRGYFEVVLMKNTPKTYGVNIVDKLSPTGQTLRAKTHKKLLPYRLFGRYSSLAVSL